jgi:vacuolar-type H+-ATPase subunit F/Vma7
MAKIAFIGQTGSFRVFTYFGATVFQVTTPQEADAKLQELSADAQQTWGIIYLDERLALPLRQRIQTLNKQQLLPVISIIAVGGQTEGLARTILNALIRKSTGVEMRIE